MGMHNYHNPKVGEAFTNILDTFSGGDNAKFAAFLFFIRAMDERAVRGDAGAVELLEILLRFSRLIDVADDVERQARKAQKE